MSEPSCCAGAHSSKDVDRKTGYVYIWGGEGIYKIGKAKNVRQRLASITRPPFVCELVHVIATDNATKLESLLHCQFAAQRKQGEWFALSDGDIASIKEMNPDQCVDNFRRQQHATMQIDPSVAEMTRYKAALQAEIDALAARRERVQTEADEQDRWWAMVTLRTREAEQKLNELSARIAEPRRKWI